MIEALLAAGANLEARNEYGDTPLHEAAEHNGNPAVIETLLSAGADLDAGYENERTPLHLAVRLNDNPAVFATLLTAAAPMARNTAWWTVLHRAAWNNDNPAVVETLRAAWAEQIEGKRAGLDCNDWNENKDFFQDASVEDVIACLNAGANPNSRGDWDRASLHHAAWWNEDSAVIEVLLAGGADVHATSEARDHCCRRSKITPLHWAGDNLNPEVTKLLLAAGADIHARDGAGQTPLHWAAGGGFYHTGNDADRNPAVIELLLAAGADVNARSSSGWTPLHFAADTIKDLRAMELLIAAGANLMLQNRNGDSPFDKARRGHKYFLREAFVGTAD